MRTPMELPPVAQTNSGRMNRHLNKIRDCLRILHSYEPPPVKRSRSGSTHPWKVSPDGSGTVAIHAGEVLGMYLDYSGADPGVPGSGGAGMFGPDSIVLGPSGSYAGSADNAITGTRYIYAEVDRNDPTSEYCESFDTYLGTGSNVELYDDIEPTIAGAATIVISASAADAYTPSTDKAAVCIAKVTNSGGVCTVDKQYVTHNPTVFMPVVRVDVASSS